MAPLGGVAGPPLEAIRAKDVGRLRESLLRWGADAETWRDTTTGRSILIPAVESGVPALVRVVLEAGVPVSSVSVASKPPDGIGYGTWAVPDEAPACGRWMRGAVRHFTMPPVSRLPSYSLPRGPTWMRLTPMDGHPSCWPRGEGMKPCSSKSDRVLRRWGRAGVQRVEVGDPIVRSFSMELWRCPETVTECVNVVPLSPR